MLVASHEATSGSVMAKQDRISPSSSGWSHRSFCSAVPNMVSTSMLPVSGAEQLQASGRQRWSSAGDLGQRCVVEVGQALGPLGAMGQEQVPQAPVARLALEHLDDRRVVVGVARGGHLVAVDLLGRPHVAVHEVEQPRLQVLGRRAECEVHEIPLAAVVADASVGA